MVHLRHYACEYLVVGHGDPLILVPGLAGGFELLGPLLGALAGRFRVISYQLRGEHNPLLTRRPGSIADLASDLADLQSALLLERPTVMGVSFGSAIALQFALSRPGQTGGLVLHGLDTEFSGSLGGHIAQVALAACPLPADNPFLNQFFRLLFAPRESVGPLFDFVTTQCWSTDQSVMAHRLALLSDFDVRSQLGTLCTPTLVIAGEDDLVARPKRQRSLARGIPDARFVCLSRAGHLSFLTHAGALARVVRDFLQLGSPAANAA
jgi:pimeloyl-ACP methyl ester carboxylesterase